MNKKDIIQNYCKQLKLGSITDNYENIKFQNKEDFIIKLFEKEIENRRVRKISTLIKQAAFPVMKELTDYDRI